MRSPKSFVVAVRRHVGGVAIREQAWGQLFPSLKFLRWPIFRGALVLAESLHNGFSALTFAVEHALPPEEDGKAKPKISTSALMAFVLSSVMAAGDGDPSEGGQPAQPNKSSNFTLGFLTLVMAVFMIALPHVLTWFVGRQLVPGLDTTSFTFHLIDGGFRLAILVGYMFLLSRTEDANKLFRYHGAEHKAIWTYESYKPLTVENAQPFTTKHPRCGTSFLLLVVGVSVAMHIALLPLIPRLSDNEFINQVLMILIKLPMAFPIAGVAYELQRISAKSNAPWFITALVKPGIWLQNITTQPPTDAQQQIALLSLDRSLAREEGKPKSKDGVTLYDTFEAAL